MMKTPNDPRVRYHHCGNCDVLDSTFSRPKPQPDSNLKECFEEENEPQLHWITGHIVIIKDNYVIDRLGKDSAYIRKL